MKGVSALAISCCNNAALALHHSIYVWLLGRSSCSSPSALKSSIAYHNYILCLYEVFIHSALWILHTFMKCLEVITFATGLNKSFDCKRRKMSLSILRLWRCNAVVEYRKEKEDKMDYVFSINGLIFCF